MDVKPVATPDNSGSFLTPQQANERMLLGLWAMGEAMFDGLLNQITKSVESVQECPRCFGFGEYISGASDSDYGEVVVCGCKEPV